MPPKPTRGSPVVRAPSDDSSTAITAANPSPRAPSNTDQPEATPRTKTIQRSPSGWPELRAWADHLDDLLKAAIATENRARFFHDPEIFEAHIERVRDAAHSCALAMRKCYRRSVPVEIRAWQEQHPGLGEHLVARLLGHLGPPLFAEPKHWEGSGKDRVLVADAPRNRTVSALWQYCGHGDPARKKAKGMTAEDAFALGSPTLKMLVHLLAEACVLQKTVNGGRYGEVYDLRRIVTATRVHATPCVRCGPSGKPALAGSPWAKAHQHADALRIVGKEILRDLWIAGRGQPARENHLPLAPFHEPRETITTAEASRATQSKMRSPRPPSKRKRERAIVAAIPTARAPVPALRHKPAPRTKGHAQPTGAASVAP